MMKINWTLTLFVSCLIFGMFVGTTFSEYHGTRSVADFARLLGSGIVFGLIGGIGGLIFDFFNPELPRSTFKKRLIVVSVGVIALLFMSVTILISTGYFATRVDKINSQLSVENQREQLDRAQAQLSRENEYKKGKYEKNYLQFEKELMTKIFDSNRVMVIQVAIMTHYDNRIFDNIKRHELKIREAMLDVMRQVTEGHIKNPNFRRDLAIVFKDEMNEILEKYENFGGVEDVFFTSFVVE